MTSRNAGGKTVKRKVKIKTRRARICKVKVRGPKKVKQGKKTAYNVKIGNFGKRTAKGVKLRLRGKGVRLQKWVGNIAAGKTRRLRLKLKLRRPGTVNVKFKVTSRNARGRTAKTKIAVRK